MKCKSTNFTDDNRKGYSNIFDIQVDEDLLNTPQNVLVPKKKLIN